MVTTKRGNEIPTIDVSLISIREKSEFDVTEYILDTANRLGVNVQTETEDAVKLVVKGRLVAQSLKRLLSLVIPWYSQTMCSFPRLSNFCKAAPSNTGVKHLMRPRWMQMLALV